MSPGRGGGAVAGRSGLLAELGPTLALAGPVVLAELGWVSMGVVDTMIVGRLGPEAVGAVGLGGTAFFTVAVFGMGLLLGLDTVVSQAYGAGDLRGCRRALVQGVYLALGLAAPLTALVPAAAPWLASLGINPAVLGGATVYLRAVAWGLAPLLIFTAFRRYLQATGRVGPIVFALLSANALNALGNWVLVFGHFGAPRLGVEGSGWATTLARIYMASVLVAYTLRHGRRGTVGGGAGFWSAVSRRPDPAVLRRLIALGLPAALHVTLEVGVFAAATALAARLDAASLAAHQIVLNVASVTFMVPLGLGTAGAVRVGRAVGAGDPGGAARAGWTTLALSVAFMLAAGAGFALAPAAILRAFTLDPRVLAVGLPLMYVAAGFQLFDGVQGVTTGNLRGVGDTHTPMACNLVAHWCLGLPAGYLLAFHAGLGVLGLWLGLSLGLVVAGAVLLWVWARRFGPQWVVKSPARLRATDSR